MIEVEVRGIPCEISEDLFDDYDLFEIAIELDSGDIRRMGEYVRKILGAEQAARVKDALRGENGICKMTDMLAFVNECVDAASRKKHGEAKN